jgi:hypothetical protein
MCRGGRQREDGMEERQRIRVALEQIIERNRVSMGEYRRWAAFAGELGLEGTAKLVFEAGERLEQANVALMGASKLLG